MKRKGTFRDYRETTVSLMPADLSKLVGQPAVSMPTTNTIVVNEPLNP
jgi:hypothetical protein